MKELKIEDDTVPTIRSRRKRRKYEERNELPMRRRKRGMHVYKTPMRRRRRVIRIVRDTSAFGQSRTPTRAETLPFSQGSSSSYGKAQTPVPIFSRTQKPQPKERSDVFELKFVNRDSSALQLLRCWNYNMSMKSLSEAYLIVLEQSFGSGKTSFIQHFASVVQSMRDGNQIPAGLEDLAYLVSERSATITLDCRSVDLIIGDLKHSIMCEKIDREIVLSIIDHLLKKENVETDSIEFRPGTEKEFQSIYVQLRKATEDERFWKRPWTLIDEILQENNLSIIVLLDEVAYMMEEAYDMWKISNTDFIDTLWEVLTPATKLRNLIIVPACPSFFFVHNYNPTINDSSTSRNSNSNGHGLINMKKNPTKLLPLMLPPLEQRHIKHCIELTYHPNKDGTLPVALGLTADQVEMLANVLYEETLGVPRCVHVSLSRIVFMKDCKLSSREEMRDAIASSCQKKRDLLPFEYTSDLDDYLRLVMLSLAQIPVDINTVFNRNKKSRSSIMKKSASRTFADYIQRFNVWYAPVGDSDNNLNEDIATHVRIIIPAFSIRLLQDQMHDFMMSSDTRAMLTAISFSPSHSSCKNDQKSGGSGSKGDAMEELITRFLTFHMVVDPIAHHIETGTSQTDATWNSLFNGLLFGKSKFLCSEPHPRLYNSGQPFPCFGFSTVGSDWVSSKKPEPHTFWNTVLKSNKENAAAMYEYVLDLVQKDLQNKGISIDDIWVCLHPKPQSAGADGLFVKLKEFLANTFLGEEYFRRKAVQMQFKALRSKKMCWPDLQCEIDKVDRTTPVNWDTSFLVVCTNFSSHVEAAFDKNGILYLSGGSHEYLEIPESMEVIVVSLEGLKSLSSELHAQAKKILLMDSASSISLNTDAFEVILEDASFCFQSSDQGKMESDEHIAELPRHVRALSIQETQNMDPSNSPYPNLRQFDNIPDVRQCGYDQLDNNSHNGLEIITGGMDISYDSGVPHAGSSSSSRAITTSRPLDREERRDLRAVSQKVTSLRSANIIPREWSRRYMGLSTDVKLELFGYLGDEEMFLDGFKQAIGEV